MVPAGHVPRKLDLCQPPVRHRYRPRCWRQPLDQHRHIQIQLPSAPGYLAADSWDDAASHLHLLEIDANSVGFIRRGKWIEYRPNLHKSSGSPQGLPLSPGNATHDFKTYGTFELPIGPGKLLMGGSHGVLARVIEGWQASAVVNLSSGPPASISASYTNPTAWASPTGLYGNSVPDIVGNFPRDGKVNWVSVSDPGGPQFRILLRFVHQNERSAMFGSCHPTGRLLHAPGRRRQ